MRVKGGPWGGPRRSRRDRGDVRFAILLLLDEQPRHNYESSPNSPSAGARWQPSPGSVYPVLKRLAKDWLVLVKQDGKNIFR